MSRPNARSAITGRGVIFGNGLLDCSHPISKRIHQIIAIREKKTVRFAELVKKLGKPEQVVLWSALEDDRDFSKAVKARRVVTVFQQNVGSNKDYGLVGFSRSLGRCSWFFRTRLAMRMRRRSSASNTSRFKSRSLKVNCLNRLPKI